MYSRLREAYTKHYSNNVLEFINSLKGEGHSGTFPEEQEKIKEYTQNINTYCEIGFNKGHSSHLVLENNPNVQVTSFDIGGDNSKKAYDFMKNIYGDRLNVIWGDSTQTIKNTPNLNCDVFFVDGGHTSPVPEMDLQNIKKHLHDESIIIMDDVYCPAAEWCIDPHKAWKNEIDNNTIHEIYNFNNKKQTRGFAIGKLK